MFRTIHGLALIVALAVVSGSAPAQEVRYTSAVYQQNATVNPQPSHLVLVGSEDLPGFGRLTFILTRGRVQMIDARNTNVNGTGWVEGNRVTFTFTDCVYQGTMIGDVITGQARFTSGSNAGYSWNYRVELQR